MSGIIAFSFSYEPLFYAATHVDTYRDNMLPYFHTIILIIAKRNKKGRGDL